jgi:indolepyruvate ferredoxin oxidoreductase alpha subunit
MCDMKKLRQIADRHGLIIIEDAMEDALRFQGPAVVIFRRICSQEFLRIARRKNARIVPCLVDAEKCIGCRTCVAAFGCPAIGFDRQKKSPSSTTGLYRMRGLHHGLPFGADESQGES